MGATGWSYRRRRLGGLAASLDAPKLEVLTAGDYQYHPLEGEAPPATVAELMALLEDEEALEGGTHSVLDIHEAGDPAAPAADLHGGTFFHRLHPLADHEVLALFGSQRSALAGWSRTVEADAHETLSPGRWTGRRTVLHADDQPDEVVFWGSSGCRAARHRPGASPVRPPRATTSPASPDRRYRGLDAGRAPTGRITPARAPLQPSRPGGRRPSRRR
ncbi:hypothetical protein ACFVFS_07480 [Kitasatospora sp. NPDC057692]|uniref:hypothetical protein n=1 Tax=Kitasatospora sp. NPDC057692 TaxID=3346215 RepID=UPI0036A27726